MELYLLRHGAAEDRALSGADRDRRLTAEGAASLRDNLQRAAEQGVCPGVILASPYQRALETAEIALQVLGGSDPVLRSQALVPDASPEDLWNEVRLHADIASVLVVSHEPLVSSTLAWLIGESAAPASLRTGSLARVDIETAGRIPRGIMRWLLEARRVEPE